MKRGAKAYVLASSTLRAIDMAIDTILSLFAEPLARKIFLWLKPISDAEIRDKIDLLRRQLREAARIEQSNIDMSGIKFFMLVNEWRPRLVTRDDRRMFADHLAQMIGAIDLKLKEDERTFVEFQRVREEVFAAAKKRRPSTFDAVEAWADEGQALGEAYRQSLLALRGRMIEAEAEFRAPSKRNN